MFSDRSDFDAMVDGCCIHLGLPLLLLTVGGFSFLGLRLGLFFLTSRLFFTFFVVVFSHSFLEFFVFIALFDFFFPFSVFFLLSVGFSVALILLIS